MSAVATQPELVERALRVTGAATLIAARDGSITWMNDAAATEVGHDPAAMRADLPQLIQLFQNLISNALTFRGDTTPQIRVAAVRNGAAPLWTFSVSDNGIGIAAEHAERVFGAFQRLNARSEYPGTGMGLAVCRRIVQRHGGTIWITPSDKAGGTTVCFTLPEVDQSA